MPAVLVSIIAGALAGAAACAAILRFGAFARAAPPAPATKVISPTSVEPAGGPGDVAVDTTAPAIALQALVRALTGPAEDVGDPRELLDMPQFQAVVAALSKPDTPLDLLRQHALGANWPAACAAFVVLSQRPDRQSLCEEVLRQLPSIRPYVLLFALGYLNLLEQRPPPGAAVMAAQSWWEHNPVIPGYFQDYFAQAADLGDQPDFGGRLDQQADFDAGAITALLGKIQHPLALALAEQLRRWQDTRVDRTFLATVGALWNPAEPDPLLVEPAAWRAQLETAEAAIRQTNPRSVLVTGDPRTGKTAFVELLGGRLQQHGWTVFATSGVQLMAGQIYIGQLEERIRQVLEALHARRKLIWYVPDLAHLADSGSHKGQAASILDQIFPAIAAGNLIIVGESTQKAAARLFQARPALRALLQVSPLEPMAEDAATGLAAQVCERIQDRTGLQISSATVSTAMDLAQHFLGSGQSPGAVMELLKRTAARSIADGLPSLTPESVIMTLSQVSGLPAAVLDTGQRVDLAEINSFFSRRVIGQDEAVKTLVDRIAMLKAGLVDPGKPIGVFLFAGPTGTGKTELAKTLAEFLFGSPDRMVRLDMSEFQAVESTAKILGQKGETEGDSLIDRIRKQPFSVVLLDEFEKAHPNCWDLFLQIFDDGRLSDVNGREADFRHCIIVLTSNLGATAHQGGGLGFGRQAGGFSGDQVLRTIGQTFRPEFINRLDKIVVFQPLSRDLMRGILNKELARVLERRGLRDRDWAVEWEASAIEFLLDRGFSPEMGARPLKRAIDQHLLAPLAATMVEHRVPEGDQFLFVRSDGARIEVEFVDPNAREAAEDVPNDPDLNTAQSLPAIVLRPLGSAAEGSILSGAWRDLEQALADDAWCARVDSLRLKLADPSIWSRDDRFATFTAVELADRIEEAAQTAGRLFRRYRTAGAAPHSRELSGRLALQLYNVRQGMEDFASDAPIDAVLRIEPALDTGDDSKDAAAWRARLYEMYRLWAGKRRMQVREISTASHRDAPILVVAGFGAFRILSPEAGLHVLEEGGPGGARRIAARVVVAAGPDPTPDGGGDLDAMVRRLAAQPASTTIIRRYQQRPAELVRDIAGGWRSGRLDAVLSGDFDLIGAVKRLGKAAA